MITHHKLYSEPAFSTALIGCRVRYRERGEPLHGVIVHATAHAVVIVALDDGRFVMADIVKLERTTSVDEMLGPYRGPP